MSRQKFYFHGEDAESCYTIESHRLFMAENGETERILHEAKRKTGEGFFYCKEFFEIGISGEGCGVVCPGYKPNNGKNGRCAHYGYCYEPTDKTIKISL